MVLRLFWKFIITNRIKRSAERCKEQQFWVRILNFQASFTPVLRQVSNTHSLVLSAGVKPDDIALSICKGTPPSTLAACPALSLGVEAVVQMWRSVEMGDLSKAERNIAKHIDNSD